jgi:hypothetical protein
MIRSGPLTVRLSDGSRDEHVTNWCPRLSFTKQAPGGHHAAQLRLNLPRDEWPNLGDADRIWLYDRRTGATVWEGYTNAPGTSDQRDAGQGFDLSAYGGMSLASDDRRPSIYLDRDLNAWTRFDNVTPGGTLTSGASPSAFVGTWATGMTLQFPAGQPIATGSRVRALYRRLMDSGQRVYSPVAGVGAGKIDTNYQVEIITRTDANLGTGELAASANFSTTSSILAPVVVTNFPLGRNTVEMGIHRSGGATTVADDTTWGALMAVSVRPVLLNPDGTDQTTVANVSYVLATEVVKDLIGRMLPLVDPAASVIATTTTQINQLAYPQAVTARTILDDLSLWEPDIVWEILHTTSGGKHVFNYRAWPTTARYEISTKDGYSKSSSDSGLCNRIAVNWTDEAGQPQTTIASATVDELGSRIRHADPITLPAGKGSAAAATAIGAAVLTDINAGADSARAVVRRTIVDLLAGRTVEPWEIEPGYLARVRETGDLLRVSQIDYAWSRDGDSAATLSLGKPRLTVEQRVARLDRVA